jgi:putative copper resistance protein D
MTAMPAFIRRFAIVIGCLACAVPSVTLAHASGAAPPELPGVLLTIVPDPLPWLGSCVAVAGYVVLVRRVNAGHPANPIPAWRTVAWVSGVAALLVALVSAIDVYADELLTVHMVQHVLLTMVAPPLLALGAPVTLLLRAATPDARRRVLLPILQAPLLRIATHPVVAWSLFAAVMWFAHFSPLYDAALEQPALHVVEHGIFLVAGVLFWWPIVAADPISHRLGEAGRFVYLVLQMPVNAAVGLAIYWAPSVLYAHYANGERSWGPSPLVDQQIGGLVMWAAGDLLLLAAVAAVIAAWMRADARRTVRADGRRAVLAAPRDARR